VAPQVVCGSLEGTTDANMVATWLQVFASEHRATIMW
jgi:hypothetical protein